jgi:hypothetical protein
LTSTDVALLGPKPFASIPALEKVVREVRRESLVEALLFSLIHEKNAQSEMTTHILQILQNIPEDFTKDSLLRLGDKRIKKIRELCELSLLELSIRSGDLDELHAWVLYLNLAPSLKTKKLLTHSAFKQEVFSKLPAVDVDEQQLCQLILWIRALSDTGKNFKDSRDAMEALGELYKIGVTNNCDLGVGDMRENEQALIKFYREPQGIRINESIKQRLLTYRFASIFRDNSDKLIRRMCIGRFGEFTNMRSMIEELASKTLWLKVLLVASVILAMFAFGFLIDPNMTSLHRFYCDSLSNAFFFAPKNNEPVKPDTTIKMSELADYDHGSTAPYPLINVALNMQGSSLEELRDRRAIPFLFSPKFVGSPAVSIGTGANSADGLFIETTVFEKSHPNFLAATAMTISGGAASPNMGRYTNPLVRLAMVLINLRLGYWIKNPRVIAQAARSRAISLEEVLANEREFIKSRRINTGVSNREGTIGLAFSGGGIRSAALNFGIAQELFLRKIWPEIDYLSTVSGGGYTGTSIGVFMRRAEEQKEPTDSNHGTLRDNRTNKVEVPSAPPEKDTVPNNFLRRTATRFINLVWFNRRCWCLLREVLGQLDDTTTWINVSDGGHIENLGVYPLLQRRCEIIIVGDGEADNAGVFDGLSRVMRLAQIDLGVTVEFQEQALVSLLKLDSKKSKHYAVAKVTYPPTATHTETKVGYLLYLRSTLAGDEDQIVKSYHACRSDFPHETTADQFFDETQFEAYRRLGQHLSRKAFLELISEDSKNVYVNLRDALKAQIQPQREVTSTLSE